MGFCHRPIEYLPQFSLVVGVAVSRLLLDLSDSIISAKQWSGVEQDFVSIRAYLGELEQFESSALVIG